MMKNDAWFDTLNSLNEISKLAIRATILMKTIRKNCSRHYRVNSNADLTFKLIGDIELEAEEIPTKGRCRRRKIRNIPYGYQYKNGGIAIQEKETETANVFYGIPQRINNNTAEKLQNI